MGPQTEPVMILLPYCWNQEPPEKKDTRSDGKRELMQLERACLRIHSLRMSPAVTTEKHAKNY